MASSKAYIMELSIEMYLESCHSLKGKRQVVKSVIDRLRKNYNASVAEIAFQDSWQRCSLGLAMISSDTQVLQKQAHTIENFLRDCKDVELIRVDSTLI
ncbi:MAG: DUF503 domain-containing protein [Gammaproteobacteria bacterium]|nr:DUF503 domain-containing protein [Gammaproteobacteria bacterium]MDH5799354.1 DUF503 domain-containing protein [Gammaproteobacteria bacterium]